MYIVGLKEVDVFCQLMYNQVVLIFEIWVFKVHFVKNHLYYFKNNVLFIFEVNEQLLLMSYFANLKFGGTLLSKKKFVGSTLFTKYTISLKPLLLFDKIMVILNWCCCSICRQVFTFIQFGSGHTVLAMSQS